MTTAVHDHPSGGVSELISQAPPEARGKLKTFLTLLAEKQRRMRYNQLEHFVPEAKQKLIMGATSFIIVASGGNRSGKTHCSAAWVAMHVTGRYPAWWEGKKWQRGITCAVMGVTNKLNREVVQAKLFGDVMDTQSVGSGMIPRECIKRLVMAPGLKGVVEKAYIKHSSGQMSVIMMFTQEAGAAVAQGFEADICWMDEEHEDGNPYEVYAELKVRLMTRISEGAQFLVSYTPRLGYTPLTTHLLHNEKGATIVHITWEDATHLDEKAKSEMLAGMKEHEVEARTKGVPMIREGLIYPVPDDELVVDDFIPPSFWHVVVGFDPGFSTMAAGILLCINPVTDIAYVWKEFKCHRTTRDVLARKLQKFGIGVYTATDPSANRSGSDGRRDIDEYRKYGINAKNADNAVELGIGEVLMRMRSGRLRIMRSCSETLLEKAVYIFKNQKVNKINDHLMDALRYAVMAIKHARSLNYFRTVWERRGSRDGNRGFKPADRVVGY